MSDKKSRWVLWGLGLACAACCAAPLYLLLGGATVGFSAGLISPVVKEILICLLPLVMIGAAFYFINKKKKSCCDSPQSNCNSQQCEIKKT
jgi:hypothetical protein